MTGIVFNKEEELVSFPRVERKVWREGNLVCKTDPLKLDKNWKKRMEEILSIWSLPAFCGFIENGYVTKYIQEGDLQGNVPFTMDDKLVKVVVGYEVRINEIRPNDEDSFYPKSVNKVKKNCNIIPLFGYEIFKYPWGSAVREIRTKKWINAFISPDAQEIKLDSIDVEIHENGIEFK